jgi:ribosomal protein S27AE
MLLIFGSSVHETIINVVRFVCGYCGVDAPQNVMKRSNRFTLFFLPLFPISTRYVNQCTNCGGETALTAEQARHSLTWSARSSDTRR